MCLFLILKFSWPLYHKHRHTLNICGKPTTTITVMHTSNHPTQYKHAAFHSKINRLLNVPLNQIDYNTEVNINFQHSIPCSAASSIYPWTRFIIISNLTLLNTLLSKMVMAPNSLNSNKNAKYKKLQNNIQETITDNNKNM